MQVKHDAVRIRAYNQKKIYDLIRKNPGISRAELAQKMKISPTSIGKITAIMIEDGLVAECGAFVDGRIGRNGIQLMVAADRVLSLAIIIDVGVIRGSVVNINGASTHEIVWEMPKAIPFPDAVERCVELIETLLKAVSPESRENIIGIGVSVPGFASGGHIHHSPQLFWQDVELGGELQKHFDYRIIVENNVKADALAECVYGEVSSQSNILILSMGSGLGAAMINNGRLNRGAHNALGEIGHILVDSNGTKCDCGRDGCLRTHIAKPSIEKISGMRFEACLDAAQNGDARCKEILDEVVRSACIWVANCIAIYDPSDIVLTGDLFRDWPSFYDTVTEGYRAYIWSPLKDKKVNIRKSVGLSTGDPIMSAASIVFYQYLKTGIQLDMDIPS
ncbi:ROK family transcriptional regulator [Ruminococcaceae bacterium OttesenSCG-928-A11]|nr:ROK family transcriptional regulator [Ruminococcaceae bacterium OttesenSCG-928-A11]